MHSQEDRGRRALILVWHLVGSHQKSHSGLPNAERRQAPRGTWQMQEQKAEPPRANQRPRWEIVQILRNEKNRHGE